jgi:glyoxylase-like metal-dependent hydrolase (beta-lactamase superfamily II)
MHHPNFLKILAVPIFNNNYSFIVMGTGYKKLVLVDPANTDVMISYLEKYLCEYKVKFVLYTHKHSNHKCDSEFLIKYINDNSLIVMAGKEDAQEIEGVNI